MMRAMIFDMDGVIADTEPTHLKAFQKVLAEAGCPLTDQEYYAKYLAMDDRTCFEAVLRANGRPVDPVVIKHLVEQKSRYFDEAMKERMMIYPGVEAFVRKAAQKYLLAVASGARRLEVEYILKKAKVRDQFTATVSADDVTRGKPDPESFWRVLTLLNERRLEGSAEIRPEECLVLEDSIHGVAAAHAAGMKCLAVTTSYAARDLAEADLVIDSFVGLGLEKVEGLFG